MIEKQMFLNNTVNSSQGMSSTQELEIVDDFVGRIRQEIKPATYNINKSDCYDELFKQELINSVNCFKPESSVSSMGGRELSQLKNKTYSILRVDPRCVKSENSDFYYYCLDLCLVDTPEERWSTRIVLENASDESLEISFLGQFNGYYYLIEKSHGSDSRIWCIHSDLLAREYWAGTATLTGR